MPASYGRLKSGCFYKADSAYNDPNCKPPIIRTNDIASGELRAKPGGKYPKIISGKHVVVYNTANNSGDRFVETRENIKQYGNPTPQIDDVNRYVLNSYASWIGAAEKRAPYTFKAPQERFDSYVNINPAKVGRLTRTEKDTLVERNGSGLEVVNQYDAKKLAQAENQRQKKYSILEAILIPSKYAVAHNDHESQDSHGHKAA